jgi:hypothetical protein
VKNPLVEGHEAQDIRAQVAKLLRDLGSPDPPLRLEMVRDRLGLDRQYYSGTDTSFVKDTVHAIKVAGRQILRRPTILFDAIRTANLRALWLPDTKRILIDSDLPPLKHRWVEGHEVGHSLIPWHRQFLLGDAESELSPSCCATIEAEANYACGQLLFLQDRFHEEANSLPPTLHAIKQLKQTFANTYTCTLWRFVEEYRGSKPVVGVVCVHPHRRGEDFNPEDPCRYVVQSPLFRSQFERVSEKRLFNAIAGYCGTQRGGPLGSSEVILTDVNGDKHVFEFETFYFHYQALTLGVHQHRVGSGTRRRAPTI